ncbi:uncharacterized protein LOC143212556 [Lasioglossum baleicum]|uniref:uncharacterized protein LOC143212556 n=1 Tax=Lasioglossum baleicum TaxID=434251 RepID=UPI003FCE9DFB
MVDYKWAVTMNRYPLKLLGLWPPENNREESLLDKLRALVFFILMNVILVFPLACMVLLKSTDFMMYLEYTGYLIPCVISVMKFVIMYSNKTSEYSESCLGSMLNSDYLVPLLNMMANDWENLKTDIERDMMKRRVSISRAIMKFCYATFGPIIFTMTVLPKLGISYLMATNESAMFPLPTYYVVDVSHSPYFEILYAIQLIIMLATAFCYLGVDAFFGTVVLHITAQLEILHTRLTNIHSSDQFEHALMDVVMNHIRLSRYITASLYSLFLYRTFESAVEVIENTYMLLLLVLLLYFGIFNCVYIFEIVYSEGIYDAAYECNWTDLKSNEARNLILIMVRAKKPFYLTAGKLFPMNILTLCNVRYFPSTYILCAPRKKSRSTSPTLPYPFYNPVPVT